MRAKLRMTRRSILQSAGASTAFAFGACQLGVTAFAQKAVDEPRGAAFHRLSLGSHDVLVLSDGHMMVPTGVLAGNVAQAELKSFLASRALGPDRVYFHINVALVKTGDDYVLIDAGAGGTWEATAGRVSDSLAAAGIAPERIGKVVLTHAHPDHLWGLIDDLDNSLRYPKAQYFVAAREFDFWTRGEAARLTGPIEGIALGAKRVFKAIEPHTTRIRPGDEIAPGIVSIDTAGHTPGHISLLVGSGTERLLITADAVQNAHIAFAHPDWQPRSDLDGGKAAQARRRLLDLGVTDRLRVLCYHIPFPGLGRIERKEQAYTWVAEA